MTIDESDLEAGSVLSVHGRDGQQAARWVVVVAERGHQDGAALGQHGRIVFGDRGQRGRSNDLDADDAQRRRDAVGDGVGEGVGTRCARTEVNRATVQVRRDRRTRRGTRDGGEAQRIAVGIGVILEGIKGDGLAGVRLEEVAIRRGRKVSSLLDGHDELATRLRALVVRNGQDDSLRAGRTALVGERQGPVLTEGRTQPLRGLRVLQVDRVAVGVTPVAQRLVLDLRTRADLDGRCAHLSRCRILAVGVNRHLHAGSR